MSPELRHGCWGGGVSPDKRYGFGHDEAGGKNEAHGCDDRGRGQDRECDPVVPGQWGEPADVLPASGADRRGGVLAAAVTAAEVLAGCDPGGGGGPDRPAARGAGPR